MDNIRGKREKIINIYDDPSDIWLSLKDGKIETLPCIHYPVKILILTNNIEEWENYYKNLLNNLNFRKRKDSTILENDCFLINIKLPQERLLGERYNIIYYDYDASEALIADMVASTNTLTYVKMKKFAKN